MRTFARYYLNISFRALPLTYSNTKVNKMSDQYQCYRKAVSHKVQNPFSTWSHSCFIFINNMHLAAWFECSLLHYVNNSEKAQSIFFPIFLLFLEENSVDIFDANFCIIMKFNSGCIEEVFLIRHKSETQRETKCRSVKVHAIQTCY